MLAVQSQSRPLSPTPSGDDWKTNFSFVGATWIGHGGSGSVFAIDEDRVIKVFSRDEEGQMDLERERTIYNQLQRDGQSSRYVVMFYEQWASGLVLQRLGSTLRQHLAKLPQERTPTLAKQWIREVCEGLAYLHENDILHSDLGCQNILLGKDGHVRICDFAGSKTGDEDAWISYESRSQHPDLFGKQPSLASEIFALGSVMFEIWTCRPPYASEPNFIVHQKFLDRNFPLSNINNKQMEVIISKCWHNVYRSVTEVCRELG